MEDDEGTQLRDFVDDTPEPVVPDTAEPSTARRVFVSYGRAMTTAISVIVVLLAAALIVAMARGATNGGVSASRATPTSSPTAGAVNPSDPASVTPPSDEPLEQPTSEPSTCPEVDPCADGRNDDTTSGTHDDKDSCDDAPIRYDTYVIVPGDTLTSISARFSISVDQLASVNDITNPNVISAGSSLRIPVYKE